MSDGESRRPATEGDSGKAEQRRLELHRYRALAAAATVLLPLVGLAQRAATPGGQDPLVLRFSIVLLCFLFLVLSYASERFRSHIDGFALAIYYVVDCYAIWLLYVNHVDVNYVIGLMLVVTAISVAIRTPRYLLAFHALTLSLTGLAIVLTPQPRFSGWVLFGSLVSLTVISYIVFSTRYRAQQGLLRRTQEIELAEKALRASEARFRELAELLPETVFEIDVQGRFTFVNRSGFETSGYTPEDIVGGLNALTLFVPEDRERVEENIRKKLTGQEPGYTEYTALRKDGSTFPVLVRSSPIVRDGNPAGLRGFVIDITERKRSEEELARRAEELARSNAELVQFANVASHDLQEPLRKVQAFGDRLKTGYGDALGDQGRDYIERMQNAARRMQTLLADLLTYSRVSTRAQPFTRVDLRATVRSALSDFAAGIAETNGHVEVGDLPAIDADPVQMRQLMRNLIDNALRYHRDDVAPYVKITGRLVGDGEAPHSEPVCEIVVEDNGIGFEQHYAERIFGMFQRLHGRDRYEGNGVGLAVCRRIVERHRGTITASSAPKRGSTFTVTLPARRASEENGNGSH